MKTNTKRIIAILAAFALGAVLAKNVKAQESDRIRQMEAEIAQLRAELEQMRSASVVPRAPEVVTPLPVIDETSSRTLPTPSFDSRGVQQLPDVVLPHINETAVPQGGSPASVVPSLGPQATIPRTFASPPTVIRSQPTWVVPVEVQYCPLTGISYPSVEHQFYYRVPAVPQYPREWDYWDEDRLGRQRFR